MIYERGEFQEPEVRHSCRAPAVALSGVIILLLILAVVFFGANSKSGTSGGFDWGTLVGGNSTSVSIKPLTPEERVALSKAGTADRKAGSSSIAQTDKVIEMLLKAGTADSAPSNKTYK